MSGSRSFEVEFLGWLSRVALEDLYRTIGSPGTSQSVA